MSWYSPFVANEKTRSEKNDANRYSEEFALPRTKRDFWFRKANQIFMRRFFFFFLNKRFYWFKTRGKSSSELCMYRRMHIFTPTAKCTCTAKSMAKIIFRTWIHALSFPQEFALHVRKYINMVLAFLSEQLVNGRQKTHGHSSSKLDNRFMHT